MGKSTAFLTTSTYDILSWLSPWEILCFLLAGHKDRVAHSCWAGSLRKVKEMSLLLSADRNHRAEEFNAFFASVVAGVINVDEVINAIN